MTVPQAIRRLATHPYQLLIARWNWKSALFSSVLRALVFLCANLAAGWRAATGAMLAEFLYRALSAGFYGAITQALGEAEPAWAAGLAAMIALPLVSHSIELTVHVLRGTPKIVTSVIASVCFTAVSTLFNLYAMRRGALIVGHGSGSVADDLKRVPRLIAGFLAAGFGLVGQPVLPAVSARKQHQNLIRLTSLVIQFARLPHFLQAIYTWREILPIRNVSTRI
jgi:hypothetical protein